ncbi:unnamed protein product [Meganyctiphanes norvegica]|uniref:G-protein coupled receptors family 1 profile domain-containing protein n=1 Tax=Meganyctiphanes norvegica TaxID=48144 RepID=A0AAV2Q336_MEGNR
MLSNYIQPANMVIPSGLNTSQRNDINVTSLVVMADVMNNSLNANDCPGMYSCTIVSDNMEATIVSPILFTLLGLIGHIVALSYLYKLMYRRNSIPVFHILLCTLMWTDLVSKLTISPTSFIAYGTGNCVSAELCQFNGIARSIRITVVQFLLMALALERFFRLSRATALRYHTIVTHYRVKCMLVFIWSYSIGYCLLPLLGIGTISQQYPGTWCYVDLHICDKTPWYDKLYTNIYAFVNLLNLCITFFCNVYVVGTLLKLRLGGPPSHPRCKRQKKQRKESELETQMCIIWIFITLFMVISLAPLNMMIFLNQIWPHDNDHHSADLLAIRLTNISQIADPWTYVFFRMFFQSRLWKRLRKVLLFPRTNSLRRRSSTVVEDILFPMVDFKLSHDEV